MSKPMYRLVDGKGRVLIPKSMREAAKLEYGGYCLSGNGGWKNYSPEGRRLSRWEDQSPEAVEA